MEDILPRDLVDQSRAVHLEGDENWEDILLQGHNQGAWWAPAERPGYGEQVASLGNQVAFAARFGGPFPGAG